MAEKEFQVNEHITLKLEKGKTNIYINNILFRQCKYLLLNIPVDKITSLNDIESIDEAAEKLNRSMEGYHHKVNIIPETEFWGHCSNLQVWFENEYDTRLLHSNLAFPLLKKLAEVGDENAKKLFKKEVARRFLSNHEPIRQLIIENGYLDDFNIDELLGIGVKSLKDLKKIEKLLKISYDLLIKNRLDDVIDVCNKILELESRNFHALNNLARAFKGKGELEKALELYNKCHEIEPQNHVVISSISEICYLMGEQDTSMEWAKKAIELESGTYEAYYYLGNIN